MNDTNPTATYRAVTVTPDLAREWLKRNVHNRALNEKRTFTLAEAMKRGEWRENGDTIRFSAGGALLDGQHRLAAVVKSGVAIRTLVVENLPDETQVTMDVGQPRSFSQVLTLRGIKRATELAALTRAIYFWETGQVRSHNRPPTYAQLLHIVENHHDAMVDAVLVACSVRAQVPIPGTIVALSHWVFSAVGPEDTEFFFDRLRDGQNLPSGHPIHTFRKWAIRESSKPRSHPSRVLVLALFIKTWNAYRDGVEVHSLGWRSGGANPESFPEPK